MHTLTWDYVAGFFDGEGCIRIFNYRDSKLKDTARFCLRASISQTKDRGYKLLSDIKDFLAKAGIESTIYSDNKKPKANWAESHALTIAKRESCDKFLIKILPYLHVKKTEAEDVLRFSKLFPKMKTGKRKEIFHVL